MVNPFYGPSQSGTFMSYGPMDSSIQGQHGKLGPGKRRLLRVYLTVSCY